MNLFPFRHCVVCSCCVRVGLVVTLWWTEMWLHAYTAGESGGWVTCQGKAQCRESAETVDKSLPPSNKNRSLSPTTHGRRGGEGRKHPSQDDVWRGLSSETRVLTRRKAENERGRRVMLQLCWCGSLPRQKKTTEGTAALNELAATNNKVIITQCLWMLTAGKWWRRDFIPL